MGVGPPRRILSSPDCLPRILDGSFNLVPRALAARLPVPSRFRFKILPLALARALIPGEVIPIPIGRRPALVRVTSACECRLIMAAEVGVVNVEVSRAGSPSRAIRTEGFHVHLGPPC